MYSKNIDSLLSILEQCNNKDNNGVRLLFSSLEPSKSGMSRKFKIHVITKNGELYNLTWIIANIMNYTFTKDGKIRVYGCGMDMLFNTCYELNNKIANYIDKEYTYNHDIAYHGYVDTMYDLI